MEIGLFFTVIAIFILVLLSAFFSGSETAFTAASRVILHNQEKNGDQRAALVCSIQQKKDRMIGALLLGNNTVNILSSALATSLFIKLFGEAGVFYATVVMTFSLLIFGEVLPKTYSLHYAEPMAKLTAPFVRIIILIFSPITEAVTAIVRTILKLVGVDISRVAAGSHLELLRGAIEMHHGPEEETQRQRMMLRSVLDLFDVDVRAIMIHRRNVVMLDAGQPMPSLVHQVLSSPYTRFPVWRERQDNILGIVHAKLLLKELMSAGGDSNKITLDKIMLEARFIPDTTALYEQLQTFRERKEHFAVVVDEYGTFMGIVTMEDILEEIVGEIDDEHDVRVPGVRRQAGGSYLVDGMVTIRDLKREFEWDLPDADYSTLAGLILYESQRIPDVGQSFVFYGFRFDIVRRQRNQIKQIRVHPPGPTEDGAASTAEPAPHEAPPHSPVNAQG
ncbi:MAG: HlyC/CorC family transporter [Alphaproteobacteria bacterium]|nr:HlyC/CorC family transporter [Alphaproteobacteria bacterium]